MQVLKEELRERIIKSAKEEFITKGVSRSSMRGIAKKAQTTVGNIYRYYVNKQELINAILNPVFKELELLGDNLAVSTGIENLLGEIEINKTVLVGYLYNWADRLADMENVYSDEMYIIVHDEDINDHYHNLFTEILSKIVNKQPEFSKDEQAALLLSRMLARAITAGLREGLKLKCCSEISTDDFKMILKHYIKYSFSLDSGRAGV